MRTLIILGIALQSLRRTRLRSGLTTLGIVIGVAAVVAMVSVGNGAKTRLEEMLARIDPNRIFVTATAPRNEWHMGEAPKIPAGGGLNIEDYRAIEAEISGIAAGSPTVTSSSSWAAANGRSSDARIVGLDVEGFELASRELVRGVTFSETDVAGAASVCLITQFLAARLFPDEDVVGQTVRIKEIPFVVIGVVIDDMTGQNPLRPEAGDTAVLMPFSSLLRRLDRNASVAIVLSVKEREQSSRVKRHISDLLERRRGDRRVDFRVGNAAEAARLYVEGSETMTLLLAAIGGISLFVGGIGIMNIMMVSVTERTREIGIRLAIGTRSRDVMRQFLVEAVMLSMVGGVVGILLGVSAAKLFTHLNGWPTDITISSILIAFLCSAGVGIFFGYYPARKAAQLDPIEALHAE